MDEQQVEDIVKCSDCAGRNLTRDETRGEVVCDDCGLVLEDNVIDQGAEWRVFSPEQGDQRARTGAPMTVMTTTKASRQTSTGKTKITLVKQSIPVTDRNSTECVSGKREAEFPMQQSEI